MYVTRSFVNTASLRQNPNPGLSSHNYISPSCLTFLTSDIPTNTLKPIKILLRDSEDASTSIQATQQQSQSPSTNTTGFTCPSCGRSCKSKAGLTSHMRGASCRGGVQSRTTSHR
uniref:C2H2-type domain-containing protein n=1 Tax=Cacopsylla melanoneura TaxID=428564 RepID=A0A8D9BXS4_9HEMI